LCRGENQIRHAVAQRLQCGVGRVGQHEFRAQARVRNRLELRGLPFVRLDREYQRHAQLRIMNTRSTTPATVKIASAVCSSVCSFAAR
jgi:hypothetical protein